MIYSPPHFDDPMHPSLYDGITNWASHARQWILIGIVMMGIAALGVLLVMDWRYVPILAFLVAGAAMGGWGLLEQRAAMPHSALIRVAQICLVVLGTIAAGVGGFALLFWAMGPAPVL
jgi:hypothetical protein